MTVSVCELKGSPLIRYENGVFTATRHLTVDWDDINAFIEELVPVSTTSGNEVVQSFGAECPYITGLYVDSFEFGPLHGDSDRITNSDIPVTYETAKFTIRYIAPNYYGDGTLPQPQQTDPVLFLEHKITSGGQLLSVDADEGHWSYIRRGTLDVNPDPAIEEYVEQIDSDVPAGTPLPILIATSQHSVHWPRVPKPNWPNLNNYKGHVNSEVFYLGGYAYQPETLLYMNYDREDKVMTNREPVHDLTLHFEGKEVRNTVTAFEISGVAGTYHADALGGHNHFWNKERGLWMHVATSVVDGVATGTPYPTADFNLLFQAGS